MKKFDDRWPGTNWDQEDLDDMETFEKIRHPEAAFMPTSGQRIARHSSHMTDGSRRASKRLSQTRGGFHCRRKKSIL